MIDELTKAVFGHFSQNEIIVSVAEFRSYSDQDLEFELCKEAVELELCSGWPDEIEAEIQSFIDMESHRRQLAKKMEGASWDEMLELVKDPHAWGVIEQWSQDMGHPDGWKPGAWLNSGEPGSDLDYADLDRNGWVLTWCDTAALLVVSPTFVRDESDMIFGLYLVKKPQALSIFSAADRPDPMGRFWSD